MSQDFKDPYYNQTFLNDNNNEHGGASLLPYTNNNMSSFTYNNRVFGSTPSLLSPPQETSIDDKIPVLDSSYMSFSECLQGTSLDFNSFESDFGFGHVVKEEPKNYVEVGKLIGGGSESTIVTHNSSISCSSNEEAIGGDEDSSKTMVTKKEKQAKVMDDDDEGGESITKEKKQKKKGEKKERQARYAFMTKSEVDNLEDGYRWRKYGQKAVKNSPYPRSYYRCTTQKCCVKKRVERSFEDPTIVITTYEGQHNHHLPTNLRGSISSMLPPYGPFGVGFDQNLNVHQQIMPHHYIFNNNINNPNIATMSSGSMYHHQTQPNTSTIQHHQQHFPEHGLLQDIVPPRFFKHEP